MYDGFAVKEYKLNDKNMNLCINKIYGGGKNMSDALAYVENQVLSFSLTEQLHLLSFIADIVNKKTFQLSEEEVLRKMREVNLATVWETVKNDAW